MPLAEAFLAEQGRISADPASSHTRSQQTSHTDPKDCPSLEVSGEILSRGAEGSSVSPPELWLAVRGGSTRATKPSDVSHLFPQAEGVRTKAVALMAMDQGTKVSRFLRLQPSLTPKEQHWDPSLLGPPPPTAVWGL